MKNYASPTLLLLFSVKISSRNESTTDTACITLRALKLIQADCHSNPGHIFKKKST